MNLVTTLTLLHLIKIIKMPFNKLFAILLSITSSAMQAQVGIGTTLPAIGTILHVDDGSGTKGVTLPNADIIDLNTRPFTCRYGRRNYGVQY